MQKSPFLSLSELKLDQCLCLQVMDLSALGAQAVAQIDRARQAAREQLQAALDQKPKLLLHVSLDAPKIAIPVDASVSGEGTDPYSVHCVDMPSAAVFMMKLLEVSCGQRCSDEHQQ